MPVVLVPLSPVSCSGGSHVVCAEFLPGHDRRATLAVTPWADPKLALEGAGRYVAVREQRRSGSDSPHAARIKIAVDPPHTYSHSGKSASMQLHDYRIVGEPVPPHIAQQAVRFIEANRQALLDYWNEKISTKELFDRLKAI